MLPPHLVALQLLLSLLPLNTLAAFSPPQVLSPLSGRSSATHPLVVTGNLVLWCTADADVKKATFVKSGSPPKKHAATIIRGKNASLVIEQPSVLDAGDYTCELETQRGSRRDIGFVYVRPIYHSPQPERLEPINGDEFSLEAHDVTAVRGMPAVISCPVHGHPAPRIKWTKDGGKPIQMSHTLAISGSDITIQSVDDSHEGTYVCEAINEFTAASKTSRPLMVVQRRLHVKSELAWIYPLAVIVAIFVVLIIVIILCETRRKRQEKLVNEVNDAVEE